MLGQQAIRIARVRDQTHGLTGHRIAGEDTEARVGSAFAADAGELQTTSSASVAMMASKEVARDRERRGVDREEALVTGSPAPSVVPRVA